MSSERENKPSPHTLKGLTDEPQPQTPRYSSSAEHLAEVTYRFSEGRAGVAPLSRLEAERKAVIGNAAGRIMRKASGAAEGHKGAPQTTGSALSGSVKDTMQQKLGTDFSSVRVHNGGESAEAAKGYGAKAFTVGSDVHFAAGQFAPGTKEGDRLLAHELAHVAQGQSSGVQRKEAEGDEHEADEDVSQPHEPAEQEADAIGDKVADDLHGEGGGDAEKKDGAPKQAPAGGKVHRAADDQQKKKPVNLPSLDKLTIDMPHILSGHWAGDRNSVPGGDRNQAGKKDMFPATMNPAQIEATIRAAYKVASKVQTQGDRIKLVGQANGLTLEIWVDTKAKIINSAYPQGR